MDVAKTQDEEAVAVAPKLPDLAYRAYRVGITKTRSLADGIGELLDDYKKHFNPARVEVIREKTGRLPWVVVVHPDSASEARLAAGEGIDIYTDPTFARDEVWLGARP